MSVNELILAKIQESAGKINDFDQRSALGMARSWINHGKLDTWNPERHRDTIQIPHRDRLAADLMVILEESGAEEEEMIAALAGARARINVPYLDPSMNGVRERRANLKPKEMKKNER